MGRRGTFRVRFAPVQSRGEDSHPCEGGETSTPEKAIKLRSQDQQRSRSGCAECKRRRVKCDETYPTCIRCQKRGDLCMSESRKPRWQLEMPWLANARLAHQTASSMLPPGQTNEHLLRHWFEHASHIMVLDPEKNPLSYSVVEYLFKSPALLHILQSISAAHEHFFDPTKLILSLEERGRALARIRKELLQEGNSMVYKFLTIILLGLSAPWLDQTRSEFGKEHLQAAGTMIEQVISESAMNPLSHYIIGKYIYWDMVCSFLVHTDEQNPDNSPVVDSFVHQARETFHPTMGYSMETFHLLASIGRYYRRLIDYRERDLSLEKTFEESLLREVAFKQEEPALHWLEDGFRKIGFITLYRIQLRFSLEDALLGLNVVLCDDGVSILSVEVEDLEELTISYARMAIDDLAATPITSPYLNLQPLQLLMAGAELPASDVDRRCEVRRRYRALFSLNRLPVNLWTLELLEELWHRHDNGDSITWLELMVLNGWTLMLG